MIDLNIISIFIKVDLLVKLVLLILVCFSIISWAIIIHKIIIIKLTIYKIKNFKKVFLSGIELINLYQSSLKYRNQLIGLEKIFFSGFREFIKLKKVNYLTSEKLIQRTIRIMRISINTELELLYNNLSFLGNIGSISPYIGLLGTIWGLIHSFNKLNNLNQITIQIISPNITEALFSTAIGLFTSIPAVMAFNHFNYNIDKIERIYNNFMEEFITILYRQDSDRSTIPIKNAKHELSETN